MRNITKLAAAAFLADKPFHLDNTTVIVNHEWTGLSLHGNIIARKVPGQAIEITTCGWSTVTTKERLNALPGVNLATVKRVLMLNGQPWDGAWRKV